MMNANDARKVTDLVKARNLMMETEKAIAYTEGHIADRIAKAAAEGMDKYTFCKSLFDGNWQMVIDNLTYYGYYVVNNNTQIIVYW